MRVGEKTVYVEHSNSRMGWYKYLGVRFLVLHRRLSEFVSKISGLHIRVIYCIQFFLDVMHVSQFSFLNLCIWITLWIESFLLVRHITYILEKIFLFIHVYRDL